MICIFHLKPPWSTLECYSLRALFSCWVVSYSTQVHDLDFPFQRCLKKCNIQFQHGSESTLHSNHTLSLIWKFLLLLFFFYQTKNKLKLSGLWISILISMEKMEKSERVQENVQYLNWRPELSSAEISKSDLPVLSVKLNVYLFLVTINMFFWTLYCFSTVHCRHQHNKILQLLRDILEYSWMATRIKNIKHSVILCELSAT